MMMAVAHPLLPSTFLHGGGLGKICFRLSVRNLSVKESETLTNRD